jgi:hypothetical protein
MDWTRRNIGTLTLIMFAIAAFSSELANALPNGAGMKLAQVSLIALAAARGLVSAAEALGGHTPAPPTEDEVLD